MMRKRQKRILQFAFTVLTAAGLVCSHPAAVRAAGTKAKPTADDVSYYMEDGKKTGLKTITINPYTYYNMSADKTLNPPDANGKQDPRLALNKSMLLKIAQTQIFPRWGAVAEGVFRDQASQLVTIEGTGMMSPDTAPGNSFDRQFSYGKSGISDSYSKYNWALTDLADTLGNPASKTGKSNAEQTEFSILKGKTNADEVVYSGIYPINNLNEARTLAGKSLRACADDDDLTVDEFLGNGYDKSDNKYRLPDLANEKTDSGFCSIVTCVNQAGDSWDYDYVTFGIAVYDFDVTPIAANNMRYIEAALNYDDIEDAAKHGVEGVYFNDSASKSTKNYLKNNSSVETTVSASLENSESEETSMTTEESFEWGMEQEIGADINIGGFGPGVVEDGNALTCMFPRVTMHIQNNFHETWSTMKGNTETKSKTYTRNISQETTLPPHTAAVVIQNHEITNEMEEYQQPVVLNYKVAIFAMSGDYYNGSGGAISSNRYDKQWMSVFFDGSDGYNPGGNNALSSLYNRAFVENGVDGYDAVYGKYRSWCDKGAWKSSNKIRWQNVANAIDGDKRASHSIPSLANGSGSTFRALASEIPFAEMAADFTRNRHVLSSTIDRLIPLYDLGSVTAENSHYDVDAVVNDRFYLDTIKLEGVDREGVEYYGFDSDWGSWEIEDADSGVELKTDEKGIQWIEIKKTDIGEQTYTLTWKVDEDAEIFSNESPDGMSKEDLAGVETPSVHLNVKRETARINACEVSGTYSGYYKESVNLNQIFNVKVTDTEGKRYYVPVFWQGGSYISSNGDVTFPSPGTFRVRAYVVKDDGTDTAKRVYSDYINLHALGMKTVTFKKPEDLTDDALTLSARHPSRSFDLYDFVSFYNQFGTAWEGDAGEAYENLSFTVDNNDDASIDNGILTVSAAGTYDVTCKTSYDYAGNTISFNKTIQLKVTHEDWLERIELEKPSISKSQRTLEEPGDEICIPDLKDLLRYYDQDGEEWEGKKPSVTFSITPSTENAEIRGGDDFYAMAPGTFQIQAKAKGYDIAPVTVEILEKARLVIKTQDPPRQILTVTDDSVSVDLDHCILITTQFDGVWKEAVSEMNYSLDDGVTGAKIVRKTIRDSRTGEWCDQNLLVISQEGEYAVHVTPKKATAYTSPIDDIVVKADLQPKASSLKMENPASHGDSQLSSYENMPFSVNLAGLVTCYDQNGMKIDPEEQADIFPSLKFELFERTTLEGTTMESRLSDSEAVLDDDHLTVYRAGQYVIRVSAMGDSSIKPVEVSFSIKDRSQSGQGDGISWNYDDRKLGALAPTCTEAGYRVLKCEDGSVIKDEIPATGHHWARVYTISHDSSGSPIVDLVCEKCGASVRNETKGRVALWYVFFPVLSGSYTNDALVDDNGSPLYVRNDQPSGCLTAGKATVSYNDEDTAKHGTGTYETNIIASGHHWSDHYEVDMEPKCMRNGRESIHCEDCGCSRPGSDRAIPKLAHSYPVDADGEIQWTFAPAPTCTETGYKEVICSDPHCRHVERETIPATGHKWNKATYTYSEDYSTVTAQRICKNSEDCTQTETVDTTAKITRYPTTEEKGQTTYTAVFDNPAFQAWQMTVTDIPKISKSDLLDEDMTAALKTRKKLALSSIKSYKEDVEYADRGQGWQKAVTAGCNAIEKALSLDEVDEALAEAMSAIDSLRTMAQLQVFDYLKYDTIAYVENISIPAFTESENIMIYLESVKDASLDNLDKATSEEELNEALEPLIVAILDAMDEDDTDRFNAVKKSIENNMKEELASYVNKDDYSKANQEEIESIIWDAGISISNTNLKSLDPDMTKEEIQNQINLIKKHVADAKALIDKIPTAAQETAKGVKTAKEDARKELTSYAASVPSDSASQASLRKIMTQASLDISCSTDKAEINNILAAAKARIDKLVPKNASKTKKVKAANPLKVKGKKATISYKKLKKKSLKLKAGKVIKFTRKGKGTMTYKLSSVSKAKYKKYFKIQSKTGTVVVKKKLKKGVYKLKIKVKAKGNANYKASSVKTIICKIRVK